MIRKNLKLFASALMSTIIGALAACHSDQVTQQSSTNSTMSPLNSAQPSSFVGTVPVSRIEEGEITPMESVAAARN